MVQHINETLVSVITLTQPTALCYLYSAGAGRCERVCSLSCLLGGVPNSPYMQQRLVWGTGCA